MKFANRILKLRIPVFMAIVLLVALSIPGLLRMDISVDIADYFIKGDDALTHQERFEQHFGKNEFVGVLFESEDIFSARSLEKIYEIGDSVLKNVPYADSVHSITNIDPRELGENEFLFNERGKLISSQAEQEYIISLFLDDPSFAGTLFSKSRKEAWIMVPLTFDEGEQIPDEFELGEMVYRAISAVDCDPDMTITALGTSVYAHRKKVEMMDDLSKILIAGALIALLLCIIIFRSKQTVIATLALIGLTPVIVLGALGWLKISADSAFISVPILLTMGISIGNAVHINQFFRKEFNRTGKRKESVVYAIGRTWRPILFTAITTIAALLSFVFVKVHPVKWVGVVSAASVLVVYILCMLFFPVILSFGKDKKPELKPFRPKLALEPYFDFLSKYTVKHQTTIVIIFMAITLAAFWGSSRVEIDFDAEKMMGTKLPHMKDQVKIKHSEISSNEFMDLSIEGEAGWFSDSIYISRLEALQSDINTLPLVKSSASILNITKKLHRLLNDGDNSYYTIPDNQEDLEWLISLIEEFNPDLRRDWTTDDYSTARIFIAMSDFSSRTIQNNISQIDTLVSHYFPAETSHFLSGSTYQMALMNQYITKGLVQSIAFSLILITLLMMISFGSIRLGLVAMFPNLFPVIVCGAIIGYTNVPLEFVTMTVAPLILGLAVDDTIHFISSLKTNITKANSYDKGIALSYKDVGIAITKTTIILSASFLVFTVSDIKSTVNMGILTCAGISAAYLADIFIVPHLVKWIRPFKIKE